MATTFFGNYSMRPGAFRPGSCAIMMGKSRHTLFMPKETTTRTPKPSRPLNDAISSPTHKLIRWVQALRSPQERAARNQYVLEGIRFISLALEMAERGQPQLDTLLYSPPLLTHSYAVHLVQRARRDGVRCVAVVPEILQQLALNEDSQGLVAIAAMNMFPLAEARVTEGLCWTALESVQKSGNLGTIIRTSEAAGGVGVMAAGNEIDFYDPKCVRSTMGGLLSQHLVRGSWAELLAWKKEQGAFWVGTSPSAELDYDAVTYPTCPVLWMGDERKGLTRQVLQNCDVLVKLPMTGRADSLNLAVSTGLMIYEVLRQKRAEARAAGVELPVQPPMTWQRPPESE